MTPRELRSLDVLGSRYDSQTTIGADLSPVDLPYPEGVEIIGAYSLADVSEGIDKATAVVKTTGDLAKEGSKALGKTAPAHDGGKQAASDIRSVTRSPILHASLAATAAVVPVGTLVAGVAEVGIGIAEGVAAIADAASDIGNFVDGLFGGGPKPLPPEKIRTRARFLAMVMLKASYSLNPKERKESKAKLAQFLAASNIPLMKAASYTQALANGFSKKEAADLAKKAGLTGQEDRSKIYRVAFKYYRKWEPSWKAAWKAANPGAAPLPVKTATITRTLDEAAKKLVVRAKQAKKTEGVKGIYVSAHGSKNRGSFVQSRSGSLGAVVLSSGRVVIGRFSKRG